MQNRREFVKGSAVFAAMMASAPTILRAQGASKVFKVGLVGCGGRGTGAAGNMIEAAKKMGHEVKIVAFADLFEAKAKAAAQKFSGDEHKAFWGGTSYQKVLEEKEIDIVILATPPAFRPRHFAAAIQAGKHVFAEKPIAVDGAGVRLFLETAKKAAEKKLTVVAGTQRRHTAGYLKQAKALKEGKISPVLGGAVYWNGTVPFVRKREPGQSAAAYLCNNWVNWTEMNGDHIVEQHVHNIDVASWFVGRYPERAIGYGGRARRVSGNQFDFFSVDFDYGQGVHIHSMCRQMAKTSGFVGEILRTKDSIISGGGKVMMCDGTALKLDGNFDEGNGQVVEHTHLLESILGKIDYLNEGENVSLSTASAIIGRISAYTGQTVRMSDILTNKESPFYSMDCKPAASDFESEKDVELPPENVAPIPGAVDPRFV